MEEKTSEEEKKRLRREQGRASARRCREQRREEYRTLCETYLKSADLVASLEKRVEQLVQILQNAGIDVPQNTSLLVQESISAARTAVEGNAEDETPDNEELFEEIMQVLDQRDLN